jgi:ATP-citrate lyase alpha-subunit
MRNYFTFESTDMVVVYGKQDSAIQTMLDYDFICGKKHPCIVAIIHPTSLTKNYSSYYFYGNKEIAVPVYSSLTEMNELPSIVINFTSARSAYKTTLEALDHKSVIKIVIIAEGIPERQTRLLRQLSKKAKKIIIGPATVGGLTPGSIKIGNAGGTIENCIENGLHRKGSVGIVCKSGGMLNEFMTLVNRVTNGVGEAIAIGGDRYPITTLAEQVVRFQSNPDISLILLLGEVGGIQELEVAELLANGSVKKPLIAWVSGTGSSSLKDADIQFGHAGAKANNESESAYFKNTALKNAGALIPYSYAELENLLEQQAISLGIGKVHQTNPTQSISPDMVSLLNQHQVRYSKGIKSSIKSPSLHVAAKESIGYVLGVLWFKREFPAQICDVFELIIKLSADHGAAVSGAHNTIVAARAGKDLVSSLASGLLTIGPRFGGAVNDAGMYFLQAVENKKTAYQFIEEMKTINIPIPGIGHRIKSVSNPDDRVTLLKKAAYATTNSHAFLNYALEVEALTTRKKETLILNIDGTIAAVLLDILDSQMSRSEVHDLLSMEAFNAFFVLARSIGMIGHFIDQKRLKQPLYRHPEWDILEI